MAIGGYCQDQKREDSTRNLFRFPEMKWWDDERLEEAVRCCQYYGTSNRTFHEWLKKGFPFSISPTGSRIIDLEAGDQYLRERSVDKEADRLSRVADEILGDI